MRAEEGWALSDAYASTARARLSYNVSARLPGAGVRWRRQHWASVSEVSATATDSGGQSEGFDLMAVTNSQVIVATSDGAAAARSHARDLSAGDGMEEALYEITPMRQFARLRMTRAIPEETMLLSFRPSRSARLGAEDHRGDQLGPDAQGLAVQARDNRGRHHHRRSEFYEERERLAIRRCTRPRKGTSYFSGCTVQRAA